MAKKPSSETLTTLQKAAKGLRFTSETDAPLEAFEWEDSSKTLSKKKLLELAGAETGTEVEEMTLEDFFYAVPPEDNRQFSELTQVLNEHLSGVKVFKVGDEAEKEAYIVGKSAEGQWAGLKTTVVET